VTLGAVTAGAVESFVNVSVDAAVVLPAVSAAVTTSVGELLVAAFHENVFESYGPPAGVFTVEAVCVQPDVVPPRAAVAEDAGPDSESLTVLRSLKLPAAAPR
jgi:hypothetical protein